MGTVRKPEIPIAELAYSTDPPAKGKDTTQLAKEVVKELRNLSQSTFGTTDRWGEL